MSELQIHRKQQQIRIRRQKLTSYFQNNRKSLYKLSKQEAICKMVPQFQTLKHIVLFQENEEILFECLFSIRQIIKDYDITGFITLKLEWTNCFRSKFISEENYHQLTYLDLIMSLLKDSHDLQIINQCTFIIRCCASQINNSINHKFQVQKYKQFHQMIKKLVKNYPYHHLEHRDPLIVQNIVIFLYEALTCSIDGVSIYFLVNKLKPGILEYLKNLLGNCLLMKIQDLKESVVRTALTVIFYTNYYNYVRHQPQDYRQMGRLLKEIVKKEMFQPHETQNFKKYCQFMKILCQNRQIKLNQKQILQIQNLMPLYTFDSNLHYFELLSKILDVYLHTLSLQSCQLLLSTLFFIKNHPTQADLLLKLQLIIIFNKHIINCGNNFRLQDAQLFVCFWGEYSKADRLTKLVSDLQNLGEKGQKGTQILFGLIAKIFVLQNELKHVGTVIDISQAEITKLLGYQSFRKALKQNQIQIVIDQI